MMEGMMYSLNLLAIKWTKSFLIDNNFPLN